MCWRNCLRVRALTCAGKSTRRTSWSAIPFASTAPSTRLGNRRPSFFRSFSPTARPSAASPKSSPDATSRPCTAEPGTGPGALEKPRFESEAEGEVWDRVAAALAPTELWVRDISGGCGSMYGIEVASEKFRGLSVLKQQRLVNAALGDLVKQWHGVQVKTRVP